MSNLPISSKYRSRPHDPVDDRERESVVARVNEAFERGVIDDWAFRRALDATFAAKTLGELAPVVEQLPAQATHDVPAIVQQGSGGRPGEVSQARTPANKTVATVIGGIAAAILVLVVLLVILL